MSVSIHASFIIDPGLDLDQSRALEIGKTKESKYGSEPQNP
jgi:hypothetical protein